MNYYECVRVCRSSSFTSSHHINITDFCCLSTPCLLALRASLSSSSPYTTDRLFTMRINILAVAAIVQLSFLPFASAEKCWRNNDDYGCGAGYQEDGYFNIQPKPDYSNCICCCRDEDGSGYHENTCYGGNIKSLDKGCGSCMGNRACTDASNTKIGDNSCVNKYSCRSAKDSFIKEYSCRSKTACQEIERTNVGTQSCGIGKDYTDACRSLWDSTIGDFSCRELESCSSEKSEYDITMRKLSFSVDHDKYGRYLTIGNNACNLKQVCKGCENYSIVPDDACNNGDESDITDTNGIPTCNYCVVSSMTLLPRVSSRLLHTLSTIFSSVHTSHSYSPRTTALHRLHSTLPRVQPVAAV